jgi:hypothetical protein
MSTRPSGLARKLYAAPSEPEASSGGTHPFLLEPCRGLGTNDALRNRLRELELGRGIFRNEVF